MKALTLRQPFASLVALGEKTIEVRTWATVHRGPILICSGSRDCILDDGDILPGGYALATASLVDVRQLSLDDLNAACIDTAPKNALAWVFTDIRELEPFAVIGRQRLFDVNPPFLRDLPGASDTFTHIDFIASLRSSAK